MNPVPLLFYFLAVFASVTALVVVTSRNVIHSAIFLAFTFLGVAGLYLLLLADFLALVQVLIYAGAVTILIIFGLMLTRLQGAAATLDNPQKPLAAFAAAAFLVVLLLTIFGTRWPLSVGGEGLQRVPLSSIGESLFTQWVVPFEVASLVLLVALIGAIIIARTE